VLKIICSRRSGGRGYAPPGAASDRLMFRYPPPNEPLARWTEGVSVGLSQVTLGDQPALAGIKHLNRLEQVLASGDRPPEHAEMLMCDAQGHVVCGTRSNLFWVASGVLMTPSLERSGVAGVMRQKILDFARQQGISTRTVSQAAREIRPDEAFLCNAVIGIWPIAEFAGCALPAPGVLTQRLRAALAHPWPCS
jgi:4-amino-4-deoxychorismate lyase